MFQGEFYYSNNKQGKQPVGITQVVSRRLATAAVQVRSQIRSCEICGGQSCFWEGVFPQHFGFTLPIFIPSTAPYSLIFSSSTIYSPDTNSVVK
jgi:hypothetical protein